IAAGNPLASVSQFDAGSFFQGDWRLRSNFTLSYGLRYEVQTNIKANLNFAPRLAFAWSPKIGASGAGKTVFRGGAGVFYERFAESLTLQSNRFNGITEQQFTISDPNALGEFPSLPRPSELAPFASEPNIIRVAGDLRSPYTIQSSVSVERQLPFKFIVSAAYANSRGLHFLRSRNV